MTAHILVVEDEAKLARLELELSSEDTNSVAYDGFTGLAAARESQPDLMILGWLLPVGQICRRLRSTGNKVPIIILSAKHEVSACVAGLDAGADDYVVKPLVWRSCYRVRRICDTQEAENLISCDLNLSLNRTREVYRGNRVIELTAKSLNC